MKLAVSNIAWDKVRDAEMHTFLADLGIEGLEVAPTRLFEDNPYGRLKEAADFSTVLFETYGLKICSMQSIWYGRGERVFGSEQERAALIDYTKRAVDFACAVGCSNLVLGSPKNRNIDDISQLPTAAEFLNKIADYAAGNGCVIAFEPNPEIYGTNFINTVSEAIMLVRDIKNLGFKINLDTGTIIANAENLDDISQNIRLVNHVHISEPFLKPIERRGLNKDLAGILSGTEYAGFVSVEMANTNCIDDIKNAARYLCEVFS